MCFGGGGSFTIFWKEECEGVAGQHYYQLNRAEIREELKTNSSSLVHSVCAYTQRFEM